MFTFTSQLDLQTYNEFAQKHPLSTLLQSGQWANIKKYWKPFYTGVYKDQQLVAVGLVLIRDLPLGLKFAYIPRGPLMDYSQRPLVDFYLEELKKLGKKEKCLFIKIDPAICYRSYLLTDKETAPILEEGQQAIDTLKDVGALHKGYPVLMHDSFQPRFTAVTHLQPDTLQQLPKKCKQALKYASQRLVNVEQGHQELLDDFLKMIHKTEERKKINLRDKEYFQLLLDNYQEQCQLYLATINPQHNIQVFQQEIKQRQQEIETIKHKSPKKCFSIQEQIDSYQKLINELEPVKDQTRVLMGSMLAIEFGHTVELLYAGTDITYSRFYPQEAIYAHLLQQAIDKKLTYFSMGGIEGTLDDGLITFKGNFNPHVHEYIGEFDIPISPLYKGFDIAWKLRTKLKANKNHD